MYIFYNPNENPNTNQCNNGFMDVISVLSFIIGLQNLDLNVTANDIDKQTKVILDDLHSYLDEQERHLAKQDKHLNDQDARLEYLERLVYEKFTSERRNEK